MTWAVMLAMVIHAKRPKFDPHMCSLDIMSLLSTDRPWCLTDCITDWVWNWDRDLPYSNVWQVIIKCQRVQKVKVALLSNPAVACGRSMAECVLWIALNCVLYLDLWRFVRPPFHSQQSRIIMSKYIYKTQQPRIIMSKYIYTRSPLEV